VLRPPIYCGQRATRAAFSQKNAITLIGIRCLSGYSCVEVRYWRGWAGDIMRGAILAVCAATFLSGCGSMPYEQRNTLIGFGLGAGTGALVASAVATGGGSIAAGAIIGAATGATIGSLIKPDACYFSNRRGELWQIPCGFRPASAVACFYGRGPGSVVEIDCRSGAPNRVASLQ
jgi:hypothetical protein